MILWHRCDKGWLTMLLRKLFGQADLPRMYNSPKPNDGDKFCKTQTFICSHCGDRVDIDTDMEDHIGGFVGSVVEK